MGPVEPDRNVRAEEGVTLFLHVEGPTSSAASVPLVIVTCRATASMLARSVLIEYKPQ